VCKWHPTYFWKILDAAYNFALDLTSIEGLHKKLWPSKASGVPILGILRFPSWESRDKMTFGCSHVANHQEYYKGEGGGIPQVWVVVSHMSPCMQMACPCTKSVLTTH
jgi:hypothetical protein